MNTRYPPPARLRLLPAGVIAIVCVASAGAKDKPRVPPPASPADRYPLHEAHDGIVIAAEPGDTAENRPNTRLDYFHHGFMPMRVIITNNTNGALSLDEARILFIAGDNYTRNAATDDELQRRMFTKKSVDGSKIPLPLPLPSITVHHPGIDKQILADDNDFSFATTTVAAHATVAGYLFYDTRDIDEPVLEHATLEVRKMRWAAGNQQVQAFDIPLQPTAAKAGSTNPPAKQ